MFLISHIGEYPRMKNNLRKLRKLRDMSLQELGDATGYSVQYVQKIETGERRFNEDNIKIFAKALGCDESELLSNVNVEKKLIPLVGYVGAGTTMKCTNMTDEPIDWIEPLSVGLAQNFPAGTMFVRVVGNSMIGSADDGDYLWLNSNDVYRGEDIDKLINKRAVVICKDGFNYYKKIKRGDKKGAYNLHSLNTPEIMENIQIQCAYFVRGVVYK
jgi:transcriptional regulator with XRE-family HTH domain